MKKISPAATAFLLLSLTTLSCKIFQASGRHPDGTADPAAAGPRSVMPASVSKTDLTSTREKLIAEINGRLKVSDFEYIENLARHAIENKERLAGGYWKLNAIHAALADPNLNKKSTDAEWQKHLDQLEKWRLEMPNSITAQVALAQTWDAWGWEARGSGFADSVSDSAWKLFRDRIERASEVLLDSRKLASEYPEWYVATLSVGRAQSWPKAQYDKVFEEGFRLEPTYYHIQREKIIYLFPQWNGEKGDHAKFVEENSSRIEGDEGQIMYFLLTTMLLGQYRGEVFQEVDIAWEKAKAGYQAFEIRYETDRYRKNQFTYLAIFGRDLDTASKAMIEIGDDWDPEVWGTRQNFERLRQTLEDYRLLRTAPNFPPQQHN